MASQSFFSVFYLSLICCFSLILAQQSYFGLGTADCSNNNYTSALGYACNGVNTSCQSYLIFRSQSPYNSVSSISDLLASDPSQLAQINSVAETATFDTNKEVIVPVNCSCSGNHFQKNASYVVNSGDYPFWIANNTFQGLSTCQALLNQNTSVSATNLIAGTSINVPVRCACPTQAQTDANVKYLMSYLVTYGDDVSAISGRFGIDTGMTIEANELSGQNPTIYPFTTLLIPLENPPSSSQTMAPPPPPPPPPPAVSPPSGSSKKTWVYVIVGVAAGVVLLLLFGSVIFLKFFRKTKKTDQITVSENLKPVDKPVKVEEHEFFDSIASIAQSIKVYKFEELQSATDNFSPSCLIKKSVYRGTIKGDLAAIKKMDGGDVSNEIALLSKINHFNVIRLSGICVHDGHWYLVQEYALNGPLSDWIYYSNNNNNKRFLVWTHRIQIALDVATGLSYLHSHISPPYIHKDIKSENVLLDTDFRAKIANFDQARSAEGQEGQFALTRHIVGTKGYMAPEYLENGLISTKLDVYAFGVLMLEMLTGKDVAAFCGGESKHLPEVLVAVLHEGDGEKLQNFMDPSLDGNYHPELAIFMVGLINRCLTKSPAGRPDMDEIVQSLSRILASSQAWESSNSGAGYQYYCESFDGDYSIEGSV